MARTLTTAVVCCVLAAAAARAADKDLAFVDLQPKANQKMMDNFHSGSDGNNLAALAPGEHTLGGIKFKIGEGLLQLGSIKLEDKPEKVEGIKVGRKLAQLHILHGTGNGAYGKEGDPLFVADDTKIGEYKVHYEDGTAESIPIIYGKDVRDWWNWDNSKEVTRGKVAWTGENDFSKQYQVKLRLYLTTWKNPKPDKQVVSIDYITPKDTPAAPLCVAMTAEGK